MDPQKFIESEQEMYRKSSIDRLYHKFGIIADKEI